MDTKKLTEDEIYAIARDGMLNAAGGIYSTRVVEFASSVEEAVRAALQSELASMTRMFHAACADLGLINEALGLDPEDGGSEPIIAAIDELKAKLAALPSDAAGAPEAAAYLVTGLNESNEKWASAWIKRGNADEAAARLYRAAVTPLYAAAVAPAEVAPLTAAQRDSIWVAAEALEKSDQHAHASELRAMLKAAPTPTVAADAAAPSARDRLISGVPPQASERVLELARQAIHARDTDTRTDAEKIDAAVNFICDTRLDLPVSAAQPDERAAFDNVKPLVDEWIRSRATSMNGDSYAAALQLAAHVAARAAAPQAALTDEQVRQALLAGGLVCGAHNTHLIAEAIRSALATAPTERMSDAARDAEDAARLDWLDKNMWHREKNPWDAKTWAGHAMWVTFAPDGIQGSARRIIDAARKAEIERSGSAGGEA